MEYKSGTAGQELNTDGIFKLFIFDVRMLTFLKLNTISDAVTVGAQVTGATSGATGFVHEQNTFSNVTELYVTNTVGTFSIGEKIKVSNSTETDKILETSGNVDVTIDSVSTHKFDQGRSLIMEDSSDASQNFTADLVLAVVDKEGNMLLDGTDVNAIAENDKIVEDDGSTRVTLETQKSARLIEPEKNISLFKLPKTNIKTLLTDLNNGFSDTQFTVRRQFIGTTSSSGVVSFSTGSNETFDSFTDINYSLSILTAGGGSGAAGDIVSLTGKVTGTGSTTITITDSSILGSGAKVKVNTTITRTSVSSKIKATNLCKQVKVLATDSDGEYGVRATDREISLGRADVYKLIAVYDSESTSADVTVPSMTLSSITGSFLRGERIVGSSTGAEARIITSTTPISYSLIGNTGATDFAAGEVITGTASKATATVGVLTAGSKVITSSFELDTGQRDNYYDISRIVRKRNASVPLGRLHIVFDFLSHGSGDVFTVDSYSPLHGQMNYDDIPVYTATKVDPDALAPSGIFPLRDAFDFRPTVKNRTGTSETITTIDTITGSSFHFASREFSGIGGVVVNSPKANTNLQADLEFFVGYLATLYLHKNGQFQISYGVGAEVPKFGKVITDALRLADISVPAFTFSPLEIKIKPFKTRRFTMRDIGKIKDRLAALEEVTNLSLLESATENFEILDQNGLSRFKSGFIVDTFKGHGIGAAKNKDYKCAVDQIKGELRPKCVMRNFPFVESVTTDSERLATGYTRTGDLITLFYSDSVLIDQPSCSRIENVQPYARKDWIGSVQLSPSGDEWFETEVAPVINATGEGDYDTVLAANQNSIGTFWGSWETISTGSSTSTGGSYSTHSSASDSGGTWYSSTTYQDTITTTTTTQARQGTETSVIEDITSDSDFTVSTSLIPYVRPRDVNIIGETFMPNQRLYVFFDGVNVDEFVKPQSSAYSNVDSPVKGSPLIATSTGKIEAVFSIPEHSYAGQENIPKFSTQKELELRITTSSSNKRAGYNGNTIGADSAGSALYFAKGVMETTQETITSTKNGILVSQTVNDTTVSSSSGTSTSAIDSAYNYVANVPYNPPIQIEVVVVPDVTTCFLPHTLITMADGTSHKPISDIVIGDKVIGRNGTISNVIELKSSLLGSRLVYGWNEKKPFVSEEHPLMTTEGWGAFNPTTLLELEPNVHKVVTDEQSKDVVEIKTGTEIVTITGNESVKDLVSVSMDSNTEIYTLMLDGDDHTFYANDILSHNKSLKPEEADAARDDQKDDGGGNYAHLGDTDINVGNVFSADINSSGSNNFIGVGDTKENDEEDRFATAGDPIVIEDDDQDITTNTLNESSRFDTAGSDLYDDAIIRVVKKKKKKRTTSTSPSGSWTSTSATVCFLGDTLVQMLDGTTKQIMDIKLGEHTKGGIVLATMSALPSNIYDYKGVMVTGSHWVMEDGQFVCVENSKHGVLTDIIDYVYCLQTSENRIWVNDIEFGDYESATGEQWAPHYETMINTINKQLSLEKEL